MATKNKLVVTTEASAVLAPIVIPTFDSLQAKLYLSLNKNLLLLMLHQRKACYKYLWYEHLYVLI
ncbi:MAG: hypothetical protein ACRCV0_00460 [Brevinema sp.]